MVSTRHCQSKKNRLFNNQSNISNGHQKDTKIQGTKGCWKVGKGTSHVACVDRTLREALFLSTGRQRLASPVWSGVEHVGNPRFSLHHRQQGPPTGPRVETPRVAARTHPLFASADTPSGARLWETFGVYGLPTRTCEPRVHSTVLLLLTTLYGLEDLSLTLRFLSWKLLHWHNACLSLFTYPSLPSKSLADLLPSFHTLYRTNRSTNRTIRTQTSSLPSTCTPRLSFPPSARSSCSAMLSR
jgi:hypothetical protein